MHSYGQKQKCQGLPEDCPRLLMAQREFDAASVAVITLVHQTHARDALYEEWDKQNVRAPIYVLDIMHVTDIAQDMHASV